MNKILLLGITLFAWSVSYAQIDELTLKSSDNFYCGWAEGRTLEEAKDSARTELLNSITTYILSVKTLEARETTVNNKMDYSTNFSSVTKSMNLMKLKNLKFLEVPPISSKYRVIAYIKKEDYEKAVNEIRTEIREAFKRIEISEQKDGIVSAIPKYYQVFLKSFYSPEPISCFSMIENDTIKCVRTFLEEKIRKYLEDIEIITLVPNAVRKKGNYFESEIRALFKGKPVSRIAARFDVPDNPQRVLSNGSAVLFIYNEPSQLMQSAALVLTVPPDKKEDLIEVDKKFRIEERKDIELDFSKLVQAGFDYEDKGGGVYSFVPRVKNLSIGSIEWDFGDNSASQEQKPEHIYKGKGRYEVKMMLNGSSDLVKKQIINYGLSNDEAKPIAADQIPAPEITKTADKSRNLIKDLLELDDFDKLETRLNELKNDGKLIYGKQTDFIDPAQCYIFLINSGTRKITGVLDKDKNGRKEMITNKITKDFKKDYKGNAAVFVEVYQ